MPAPQTQAASPDKEMDLRQRIRLNLSHRNMLGQVFASLPRGIRPERFAALCLDQLEATLAQLSPEQRMRLLGNEQLIYRAAQRTASMGLLPGRGFAEVAWIYRKGYFRKKDNTDVPDQLDVMPQWQGYLRLMRSAAGVIDVEPVLVHELDTWTFRNGDMVHEYDLQSSEERVFQHPDLGQCGLAGGYVRITYESGRVKFVTMTAAQIHKRRLASQSPGRDSIWSAWFEEMALKTLLRYVASRRAVDWSADELERITALEEADRSAGGDDPRAAAAMVESGASAATSRAAYPTGDHERTNRTQALPEQRPETIELPPEPAPVRTSAPAADTHPASESSPVEHPAPRNGNGTKAPAAPEDLSWERFRTLRASKVWAAFSPEQQRTVQEMTEERWTRVGPAPKRSLLAALAACEDADVG